MFAKEDCQVRLITREIVESGSRRRVYKRIEYVASCGHEASIRLQKFMLGEGRICPRCARPRGERHFAYNPNLADEDRVARRDIYENTRWRFAVYSRDDFRCRVCGDSRGGNLEAHHLNSYTDYPEERFVLSNGITLCKDCHYSFHHKYTYHHNTREQFMEWLKQDNTEVSGSIKELPTP